MYCKLADNRNLLCHSSGGCKTTVKVPPGPFSVKALEKDLFCASFLAAGGLKAFFSLQVQHSSFASILIWPLLCCLLSTPVFAPKFSLFIRTPVVLD